MNNRREFLKSTALSAGALPFLGSSLLADDGSNRNADRPLRIVFMFTPNGMVRNGFWPDKEGQDFEIKEVLKPLEKYREQMLIVKGICNFVRGDGDNHMRGMSSFLTAIELFPGNVQGGSHTPAGWAKGISIDQEIKNHLQSQAETKTRFGSLEFGVCVRNDANPWTRWVYSASNQPVAPISDPYLMFEKMYGRVKEQDNIDKVLSLVDKEIEKVRSGIHPDDAALLQTHEKFVEQMKTGFATKQKELKVPAPVLPPGVPNTRDRMPELAKMQMDLLVNGFANDLNRVATLQFTESVGQPVMKWLDIKEGHHALSHDPDLNKESQAKLVKINHWYCQQLAYLVEQLEKTKQPGSDSSLLDDTLIVWANELGHGNSHTLNDIPILMVGGKNFGFKMGRYLKLNRTAHNRLWLTLAHRFGHKIEKFGNPRLCKQGPLDLSK